MPTSAAILEHVRELGKEHGRGPVARFVLAAYLCTMAHHEKELTPEDAPAIWAAMKAATGNDHPDIANELVPFIRLGRRDDLNGPELLRTALNRLIALKQKGALSHALSWQSLLRFANAQAEMRRPMPISAIDLLLKRAKASQPNGKR